MQVHVYKTPKVTSGSHTLTQLLDSALSGLEEGSVVAIASKVVALCEKRVAPIEGSDKDTLIKQEAQWYLPRAGKYHVSFTITHNLLIPTAGIDESNGDGNYILWPVDPQSSANSIREHLLEKHGLKALGVVITDSTTRPLQWGTTGIAIAYSGFKSLNDYIGQKDLFGRTLQFQKSNVANGLAATAVTVMGEGDEQTPLAVITDIPFVTFQDRNPTEEELADTRIEREDDLYWPLLQKADWEKGES